MHPHNLAHKQWPILLHTSQEGVVGIDSLEQNRGQEEGCTQAKSHNKFMVTSINILESRIATLETSMLAVQDTLESLEVRVNNLGAKYSEFMIATKALFEDLAISSSKGSFAHYMMSCSKVYGFVQSELRAIRAEADEVRSDWAWHKCTLFATRLL